MAEGRQHPLLLQRRRSSSIRTVYTTVVVRIHFLLVLLLQLLFGRFTTTTTLRSTVHSFQWNGAYGRIPHHGRRLGDNDHRIPTVTSVQHSQRRMGSCPLPMIASSTTTSRSCSTTTPRRSATRLSFSSQEDRSTSTSRTTNTNELVRVCEILVAMDSVDGSFYYR